MAHLVSIDNGGTFTDICVIGDVGLIHSKVLTTPYDLTKCFLDVIVAASERLYGEADITRFIRETEYLRYSTTAGTNAMVERIGPPLGLIVRNGWKEASLTTTDTERELLRAFVADRIATIDTSPEGLENSLINAVNTLGSEGAAYLVVSLDGPGGPADEARVKTAVLRRFPRHLLGAIPVLFSHELVEDLDDRRRTWSALVDAFLHQTMERFLYNAERELQEHRSRRPLLVYANDGSSSRVAKSTAIKTHGSGPRGGLEAASALADRYDIRRLVSLDIGGTTTDVALVERMEVPERDPGEISGLPVSFRMGDVASSGIGGSSVFSVQDKEITVGPRSVGAVPGPACFGRGGTDPTITDAFLLLGVLDAGSYFGGTLTLDRGRAEAAITEKIAEPLGLDLTAALLAMESAYNGRIATEVAGKLGPADGAVLLAFGGAGPMNACGVADAAGISTVIVPCLAAVLSAFGMNFSDISHSYRTLIPSDSAGVVNEKLAALRRRAERDMFVEGFELVDCTLDACLRPVGGGAVVELLGDGLPAGHKLPEGNAWLDVTVTKSIPHYEFGSGDTVISNDYHPTGVRSVVEAGGAEVEVPVTQLADLKPGMNGYGPVLIEDEYFTCRVTGGWRFEVTPNYDIWLSRV